MILSMRPIFPTGSSLSLLVLGSLILISGTDCTSDSVKDANQLDRANAIANGTSPKPGGMRQRSGRIYSQQSSSPLDSYAAAYAAANSFDSTDQPATNHQLVQQQTVSDGSAYSTFGETPPAQTGAPSASARQMSNANEYAPSSSYFASYMSPSSNEASLNTYNANNQHQHHYYKSSQANLPLGYPTNAYERYPMSSYYDRAAHHTASASMPFMSAASLHSGGLMSSATSALSHWTNGFSIGEIICGLVAISIAAVILGAPFFLIYLALMGNFSGSGTLSLTNPTSSSGAASGASTTPNGRRKRLAVFESVSSITDDQVRRHPDLKVLADSVVRQLSPFIDLQQVSMTFKHLAKSIERYAPRVDDSHTTKSTSA